MPRVRQSLCESIGPRNGAELVRQLVNKSRFVDLSVTLLRFRTLELKPIEVMLEEDEEKRQVLLVAPRGKVLLMPDERRIVDPSFLTELEQFVNDGLRKVKRIQNDAVWAALVGLMGVFGLILGFSLPALQRKKDKAKVRRWIDGSGNAVYLAEDPAGTIAHLLLASYDRRYFYIYEPLANALKKAGHYVLKLTYPASTSSWREALGLKVDPTIEFLLDPELVE